MELQGTLDTVYTTLVGSSRKVCEKVARMILSLYFYIKLPQPCSFTSFAETKEMDEGDYAETGPDKGTKGQRDKGTKGQRDTGTKGQRDKGTKG